VDDNNAAANADHWPSPPRATDACGALRRPRRSDLDRGPL